MKRQLEAVDIFVAIGMVATLLGGYLVFKASYGGALAVTTPSHLATNPPVKCDDPIDAATRDGASHC